MSETANSGNTVCSKKTVTECGECGSERCEATDKPSEYVVEYHCPDCGWEGSDCYSDLYGCMSVPWGFLL